MKQKSSKLPYELHDPKPPAFGGAEPLDLSDQLPDLRAESVLRPPMSQPDDGFQPPQLS